MIDCIIIGAGPSGMMAAGTIAEKGKEVMILEKMSKPCLKLGITGKGRCNLTNLSDVNEIIEKFNSGGRFLKYALHEWSSRQLIDFFQTKGLKTKVERGNRVFPVSDKALEVVGILKDWVRTTGGVLLNNVEILEIVRSKDKVEAVKYRFQNKVFNQPCKNIVLATGGLSYPRTGSTGDGYQLAEKLGHNIVQPKPALVPLTTDSRSLILKDLKLKNIKAILWSNNKKVCEEFGELDFTDFGVDGPVILTMSTKVVKAVEKKEKIELSIDLKPALDNIQLKNRIIREIKQLGSREIIHLLKKLLPGKLADFYMEEMKIDKATKCTQFTAEQRKRLEAWLKNFQIKITGYRPIAEAIVTSGGVNLKEINPVTMESKLLSNLYIVGELLDIDAKTGGYNLQAAFSTGYVAGKAIGTK